jgi:hypothetical protein
MEYHSYQKTKKHEKQTYILEYLVILCTYYFGKVNLSIVVPALLATQKDLSKMNVAAVYFFHFRFNNAL